MTYGKFRRNLIYTYLICIGFKYVPGSDYCFHNNKENC